MTVTPLKHLDLFSGIGGFALGLKRAGGFETVAFCEIDKYCQKILAKNFPGIPIHDDVRTLKHDGPVDIITGGYPCQPFSMAGKRQGPDDDRHLWPAMFDLIKKHRPTWVVGENVAGHLTMGLDDVLADLEGENYAVRTFIIPACATGAKHRRDRLWIVANCEHRGLQKRWGNSDAGKEIDKLLRVSGNDSSRSEEQTREILAHATGKQSGRIQQSGIFSNTGTSDKNVSNPDGHHAQGKQSGQPDTQERTGPDQRPSGSQGAIHGRIGAVKPELGRGLDGLSARLDQFRDDGIPKVASNIPNRVNRLKGLGNAVVPQIPEMIGRAIINSMKESA